MTQPIAVSIHSGDSEETSLRNLICRFGVEKSQAEKLCRERNESKRQQKGGFQHNYETVSLIKAKYTEKSHCHFHIIIIIKTKKNEMTAYAKRGACVRHSRLALNIKRN